jgi:SAM-dependent methyltransferase
MGLLSVFAKFVHLKYKHMNRINEFYLDRGAEPKFEDYVLQRLKEEAFPLEINSYFLSPHNPLAHLPTVTRWIAERYKPALKYVDRTQPKSILEVGCGFGLSTWFMSEVSNNVVGVDISPSAITVAKKLFPDTEYVQSDTARYFDENPDCYFDLIIDCYGATGLETIVKYRKHYGKFIKIGLRPRKSQFTRGQYLAWKYKIPGYHIGFNCTLYDGEKRGISALYPLSYFGWSYFHELRHAVQHKKLYLPF